MKSSGVFELSVLLVVLAAAAGLSASGCCPLLCFSSFDVHVYDISDCEEDYDGSYMGCPRLSGYHITVTCDETTVADEDFEGEVYEVETERAGTYHVTVRKDGYGEGSGSISVTHHRECRHDGCCCEWRAGDDEYGGGGVEIGLGS